MPRPSLQHLQLVLKASHPWAERELSFQSQELVQQIDLFSRYL